MLKNLLQRRSFKQWALLERGGGAPYDRRMTSRHVLIISALLLALASGLALAQTKATVVTGSAQPMQKWDAFCADAIGSGVKGDTAEEARETGGWNAVLKRYGEGGWEPYQMLTEGKHITGVCFRRHLQ